MTDEVNDLSYRDALRLAELRAVHDWDQALSWMKNFSLSAGAIVELLSSGIAFMQSLADATVDIRSDVRLRALLLTPESFERQYAKQRANYRRRVRSGRG